MKKILLSSLMALTCATPLMGMQNQDPKQYYDIFRITACYCSFALCNIKPDKSVNVISTDMPYKDCCGTTICGVSCHTNCNKDNISNSATVNVMN